MAPWSLVHDVYTQYLDPTHIYVYVSVQYVPVDFAFRWATPKDRNAPNAFCVVFGHAAATRDSTTLAKLCTKTNSRALVITRNFI